MKATLRRQTWIFALAIAGYSTANAQTIKTDVLVLGNGNAAWAAAGQAAHSSVSVIALAGKGGFHLQIAKRSFYSGAEAEFFSKLKPDAGKKDQGLSMEAMLKKWGDSTKNLNVHYETFQKLLRSGKNWEVKLPDGKTIKAKVLINASGQPLNGLKKRDNSGLLSWGYENNLYRTSIASGLESKKQAEELKFITLAHLLVPEEENYVDVQELGDVMPAGQAAGAIAAYSVFFKTKTSKSRLKYIQGELLNYKSALVPFSDISPEDPNWQAIQQVALSGVFQGKISTQGLLFHPNDTLSFDQIRQPLKDLYYKAQIWFEDHSKRPVNLENTIDMICYVGNKSVSSLIREIEKKWKKGYKFSSEYDLQHLLSRREMAVLLQDYLQPFDVNIDDTGSIVR